VLSYAGRRLRDMTRKPGFLTENRVFLSHADTSFATILRSLRVSGGIFLEARFSAPWCISARVGPEDCAAYTPVPARVLAFHYVSGGAMLAAIEGHAPVPVGAGEMVLFPRNDVHTLGDDLSLPPVDTEQLIRPGTNGGLARIEHGGGGEVSRLICGFLGTDSRHEPLLALLPPVFRVCMSDAASADWVQSSFHFAARATAADDDPEVVARIAELLFVAAVRRYFETIPEARAGWSAGLRDPKIADVLGRMHAALERPWTADELAAAVAMSRSAFRDRFQRVMGESPMRYLARQRLGLAATRLRETRDPIARIAVEAGYESQASFSRAFRREYSMPPAAWRRAANRS
jgi:AraC-like DNA-binding protein